MQVARTSFSSIDHQRLLLRLLGENQYPVSRVISGGEDAEEKIAARKRMLAGVDPTRHVEEGSKDTDSPKGESAALSKSMLLEMYLSDRSRQRVLSYTGSVEEHVIGDVPL